MKPGDRVLYTENRPINLTNDLGEVVEVEGPDEIRVLFDDGLNITCGRDEIVRVTGSERTKQERLAPYDAKGHSNRYP